MKTEKKLSGTIFFLLFITIVFGVYTTQIAQAENIPNDLTTIPTSGSVGGGEKEMKLPETIGEEIPAPNNKVPATRGTSSLPEGDKTCATVDGELRCAPKVIQEPK